MRVESELVLTQKTKFAYYTIRCKISYFLFPVLRFSPEQDGLELFFASLERELKLWRSKSSIRIWISYFARNYQFSESVINFPVFLQAHLTQNNPSFFDVSCEVFESHSCLYHWIIQIIENWKKLWMITFNYLVVRTCVWNFWSF